MGADIRKIAKALGSRERIFATMDRVGMSWVRNFTAEQLDHPLEELRENEKADTARKVTLMITTRL